MQALIILNHIFSDRIKTERNDFQEYFIEVFESLK